MESKDDINLVNHRHKKTARFPARAVNTTAIPSQILRCYSGFGLFAGLYSNPVI
jgi:hypothetical protein